MSKEVSKKDLDVFYTHVDEALLRANEINTIVNDFIAIHVTNDDDVRRLRQHTVEAGNIADQMPDVFDRATKPIPRRERKVLSVNVFRAISECFRACDILLNSGSSFGEAFNAILFFDFLMALNRAQFEFLKMVGNFFDESELINAFDVLTKTIVAMLIFNKSETIQKKIAASKAEMLPLFFVSGPLRELVSGPPERSEEIIVVDKKGKTVVPSPPEPSLVQRARKHVDGFIAMLMGSFRSLTIWRLFVLWQLHDLYIFWRGVDVIAAKDVTFFNWFFGGYKVPAGWFGRDWGNSYSTYPTFIEVAKNAVKKVLSASVFGFISYFVFSPETQVVISILLLGALNYFGPTLLMTLFNIIFTYNIDKAKTAWDEWKKGWTFEKTDELKVITEAPPEASNPSSGTKAEQSTKGKTTTTKYVFVV